MPGFKVDGQDPLAVYEVMKEARERAATNGGPTLIEAETIRLTSHSSDDNHLVYRTEEELEQERKNDPNILFANYLKEVGVLTDETIEEIDKELTAHINEATENAEKAPYPSPETLYDYVYEQ